MWALPCISAIDFHVIFMLLQCVYPILNARICCKDRTLSPSIRQHLDLWEPWNHFKNSSSLFPVFSFLAQDRFSCYVALSWVWKRSWPQCWQSSNSSITHSMFCEYWLHNIIFSMYQECFTCQRLLKVVSFHQWFLTTWKEWVTWRKRRA